MPLTLHEFPVETHQWCPKNQAYQVSSTEFPTTLVMHPDTYAALKADAMFGHAEGGVPEGWPLSPDWSTGPFLNVTDEGFMVT